MSVNAVDQQFYVQPLAGAGAIAPLYYLFARKTSAQLGLPTPKFTPRSLIVGGLNLAPTAGLVVGLQVALEGRVKKKLFDERDDAIATLGSAAVIGGFSVYPLAILNGQSMGRSPWQSIVALDRRQAGACVAREMIFITGLVSSKYFGELAKGRLGESKALEYAGAFFGGAAGSLFGHPFDSVFTLLQKGMPVQLSRSLWAGGGTKALACGLFSVNLKALSEFLA